MDRAGDAVEQPGMVGGIDGHQGRAAIGIDLRVDRQRRVVRPRAMKRALCASTSVGLGDPIGLGQAADIGGEARVVPAERRAQRVLLGRDPLAAAALLVAEPQHLLGRLVEVAEQLTLPAVPDAGPDRADVDDGQQQQQPQPLGALHGRAEIEDRLEVATGRA